MGDKILRRSNKDDKKSLHYQTMLRLYLKSFREDNGLTQAELAESLSCSKQNVEVLENKSKPSAPISALLTLEKLGALRNIPADSFASILLGKKNEEGEENRFLINLAKEFGKLKENDQLKLKQLLRKKDFSSGIKILESYLNDKKEEKDLYETISSLSDEQKRNLNRTLKSFIRKQEN